LRIHGGRSSPLGSPHAKPFIPIGKAVAADYGESQDAEGRVDLADVIEEPGFVERHVGE
jgi:hypothetical protein